ncbi:hypothetical protein PG988_003159 [Apiospora saccharicola]
MVHIPIDAAGLAVCDLAIAHPGEHASAELGQCEMTSYRLAHQHMIRATSSCASSTPDQSTSPDIIFAGNASCALVAETTIGPYFVSGELLRITVTEGQKGVPLHLDIQFIGTSTCSPVKDMVIDGGMGSNFCRGVQVTDADGVVELDTVPGHYAGRANHVHILSTKDAKLLLSGEAAAASYEGGVATHIGQLFFDRDLVSAVEATEPYNRNPQQFVDLLEDGIAEAAATSDYDVLMDHQMLGDTLAEGGVLAWITVGVDVSANYSEQAPPAAHFTGNDATDDGGSNSSPTSTTDYLGTLHARHRTPAQPKPVGSSTSASGATV